ncbi:MAG: hypothetical protein HYY85_17810, partial [Deltaproteobacteria bacterium]|nr:hypothetical protein [Deltaproteobacteria bacterium]
MTRIARGRQGMAVGPALRMVAVLLAPLLLAPAVASAQGGPVKWRHGIVPPKADTVFQIIGVEKG